MVDSIKSFDGSELVMESMPEIYDKDYFNGGKVTWKKYCNY